MKFGLNWPSGISGEGLTTVDGPQLDQVSVT